ncbi:unnamed protein product (macronuclear) [Paramecium tetraurelia]|uniref:Uncharacterized protein n=1 Tax=Paramecium tetraurelia TaxID=5888 RepID=A0DWL8_PARTE|nr:uncharacterized protein GSPATT00021078001 [Paramecium tetraurelia]CAK87435.1 unnamed protein product [Paramecium tetraurelia]|eukprot:XP_001454832.1 hypothetical protein (macronuclear) [Paramecium tetraurelia strain d4-2]
MPINQSSSNKLQISIIISLLFQFIRVAIQYQDLKNQYINFLMINLLVQIALELLCFKKKSLFQTEIKLALILMDIILFYVESFMYGVDNVYQVYFYIEIVHKETDIKISLTNSRIWKTIRIFFFIILLLSFTYQLNLISSISHQNNQQYIVIANQKLYMLLLMWLLPQKNIIQIQKPNQSTVNGYHETPFDTFQNTTVRQTQTKINPKRTIIKDLSFISTDKQQKIQINDALSQIDYSLLFDVLSEGVIIVQFGKFDHVSISKPRIEYQNQISKKIFQKNNHDLLTLFEQLPCEIFRDESPLYPRDSQFSLQSLNQQQKKYLKNSKMNFFKYYSQDQHITLRNTEQSQSPRYRSMTSQANTIYKCLLYVFGAKKLRRETVENAPVLVVETSFEIENTKRSIEISISIASEDLLFIIARDVIHRKNIKELLQINQSKSKTLAFVSHEFRSPLNVVINILSRLKEQLSNFDYICQNISIVLENSNYMLNLANDLLDLAQIKADKFSLIQKTFNLTELGEECLQMFKLQAELKNIKLNVISNVKCLQIKTDRNRLKQILVNLIANALKFTQKGAISIKLVLQGLLVSAGVEDTGVGISQNNLTKLFKAFGKIKEGLSENLNEQGVGLGLLISNKLAQQLSHDNSGLKVISQDTSQAKHGSYFYLTLRIQQLHHKCPCVKPEQIYLEDEYTPCLNEIRLNNQTAQTQQQYQININREYQSISQSIENKNVVQDNQNECKHILIVDDNVFNQQVLEMQIKQFTNSQIDKAFNGTDALDQVMSKKCCESCKGYIAIFMDMEMPGLNGIQTSVQILKTYLQMKIFITSGYDENILKDQGQNIGIKEFLVKPISKQLIEKVIRDYNL